MRKIICLYLILLISVISAADFELSRPTIEMRRLQFCGECREPLVVTTIATGAAVRCPKCANVARRLPDRELLVKVYQVCPSCSARLEVAKLSPDAPFRCGSCGLAQRVMPEAIHLSHSGSGVGEIPAEVTITPLDKNTEKKSPREAIEITPVPETAPPQNNPQPKTAPTSTEKVVPLLPLDDPLKISVLVNGQAVSTAEVQKTVQRNLELLQLRSGEKPSAEELAQLRQNILEQLIEREILRQEAMKTGFVPREEEVQTRLAVAPNSLTRAGVQAEMVIDELKKRLRAPLPNIGEPEIAKYYAEHQNEFTQAPRLQLRTLTIYKSREQRADRRNALTIAQEVKEKLDFGIKFSAVAGRYSEDVFRTEGGILRTNSGDDTVAGEELAEPLSQDLVHINAGEILGPIDLPTAIIFCEVIRVVPAKIISLSEGREQIIQQIHRKNSEAIFQTWLEKLKKAAVIEYQ